MIAAVIGGAVAMLVILALLAIVIGVGAIRVSTTLLDEWRNG